MRDNGNELASKEVSRMIPIGVLDHEDFETPTTEADFFAL